MARVSARFTLTVAFAITLAAPAAAVPVASFTYSPAEPYTGETVTFTSTSTGATTLAWDLDGDGSCTDASGSVVTTSYAIARVYQVKLCAGDGLLTATQTQPLLVRNRPPAASISFAPAAPVTLQPVTLTSSASDPDGSIVAQEWDLDADGAFDDAAGPSALYFWARAGTYAVGLRVTDNQGASTVANAAVVVAKRPPGVFSPTPLVRVVGSPTATGARIAVLSVSAPEGANVGVRCKGRGCPYRRKRFTSNGKRVTLRKLSGRYPRGTVIEVRVTRSETIGKFTRLRIRAGRRPARLDRCLAPGHPNRPIACPRS